MKHIILALVLSLCSLHAADTVAVISATSVTVNGVPSGKPADTIRNRPELASAIQLALEKRETEQAAALAAVQAKLDAALATRTALIAKAKAKLAELPEASKAIVRSVIADAEMPDVERRRAQLAAELTAKQKELDAKQKELDALK
jgi:hypothetical protein